MPEYLYHFTSVEGRDGILRDRRIRKSTNTTRDAHYGVGVYLTDMPPGGDDRELLRNLFGRAYKSKTRNIQVCFRFRKEELQQRVGLEEEEEERRTVYVTRREIEIDRVTTDMMSRAPDSAMWPANWQRI